MGIKSALASFYGQRIFFVEKLRLIEFYYGEKSKGMFSQYFLSKFAYLWVYLKENRILFMNDDFLGT